MPDRIEIATQGRRFVFAPGEVLEGSTAWELEAPPRAVSVALLWYTEGRGDQDVGVVATQDFEAPGQRDRRDFAFTIPRGPLSFSGTLISLAWALEVVAEPEGSEPAPSQRIEILVSSTGEEIRLREEPLPEALEKFRNKMETLEP